MEERRRRSAEISILWVKSERQQRREKKRKSKVSFALKESTYRG